MSLDEIFTDYGDLSYFEVDKLWRDGNLTWAEKAILQANDTEYKLFDEDMKNGRDIPQTKEAV